jgi:hypothetical protein
MTAPSGWGYSLVECSTIAEKTSQRCGRRTAGAAEGNHRREGEGVRGTWMSRDAF